MRKFLALIIIVLFCLKSFSQNEYQNDQKIGLVLSGGGAKGLAHIGVLKVIDSLGIKVDYIAGTSMGAIIGSLYASGYSGKQLDSIFKTVDFENLINDKIPRRVKSLYERENSERYALTLPFENFKLQFPSAISRGQNVYDLLTHLTLHVSDVEEFDKLPTPFFCVATDVETGEAIFLDKGNLAQAVTASGAFPSLFRPVNIDGRMLIDGGVVNNYPIDELKAKGMDVIIGVDVQDDLAKRDELTSAPDILLQINNYRTINAMKEKAKRTDIYIKPNIEGFTVISFDQGEKIIENGHKAALNNIDALQKLAPKEHKNLYRPITLMDSIKINSISIKGNERYTRAYILGKLKLKDDPKISYEDFNEGVNNLLATNNFDAFRYEFNASNEEEGYDLKADVEENDITTFVRLGIHYDNLYKSSALLNITKKRFLFDNDVVSLDAVFGDNLRYDFEYFIDKGFYWSIGLKSRFNQFHRNISASLMPVQGSGINLSGINKIDVEYEDLTNQIYLQTLLRKDFSLRLGAEHKHINIESETVLDNQGQNEDEYVFENTDYFSVFGSILLDTYNNKYFPKNGVYFNGDFHLYYAASNFNEYFSEFSIVKADFGYAFRFFDKFSLNLMVQGGFKIGGDSTSSLNFALGGYGCNFINNFKPFYGFDYMSLTGDSFVKSTATFDYEWIKKHHIIFAANFANIEDDLFAGDEWISKMDYSGYAFGYGIETFLGPIEAKYSWSPESKKGYLFFNFGFWF